MRSSWTQSLVAAWGEVTDATKHSDRCYNAGGEEASPGPAQHLGRTKGGVHVPLRGRSLRLATFRCLVRPRASPSRSWEVFWGGRTGEGVRELPRGSPEGAPTALPAPCCPQTDRTVLARATTRPSRSTANRVHVPLASPARHLWFVGRGLTGLTLSPGAGTGLPTSPGHLTWTSGWLRGSHSRHLCPPANLSVSTR